MNVVEACGITKMYGRWRVVDDLNMHVRQGDIYGFVGKNGAGKPTAMKMICGLVTPTAGSVKLFGEEAAGSPRTGALIEAPGILPRLSVSDNLMTKALALGIPGARSQCDRVISPTGRWSSRATRAHRRSARRRTARTRWCSSFPRTVATSKNTS